MKRLFKLQLTLAILLAPFARFCLRARAPEGKKFLVVPHLTRVGDLVCSTPVFRALKEAYPESSVVLLVSKKAIGIIRRNPHVDAFIIYEDYKYTFWELARRVAAERFSAGVSLSGTALSTLLFFYGRIPKRVKLTRRPRPLAESLTDWLATDRSLFPHQRNLPRFYLRMLSAVGVSSTNTDRVVSVTEKTREAVNDFLAHRGIGSKRLLGVSITTGNRVKEWGDERFAALCRALLDAYDDIHVVALGSPADAQRVGRFRTALGPRATSTTHFSLEELPALLERLSVLICGDTGPLHVADALGTPTVHIIGPVDDRELTPRGPHIKTIYPNPRVPPTIFSFKPAGDFALTRKALDQTSPKDVIAAAQYFLSRTQTAKRKDE